MLNNLINFASTIQGRRFAKAYKAQKTGKAARLLDSYISLRRRLPLMPDGRHFGNHKGSKQKPLRATQGL